MGKYAAAVHEHLVLPALVRVTPGRAQVMRSSWQLVPPPVSIRLLIDTGSKRTTLIPGLIHHLQVPAQGSASVTTPWGFVASDLFWVSVEFPEAGLAPFPEVLVARLPMPAALSQFHGLLGRDLLRRLESFEYEGRRGCYTIRDAAGVRTWLRRWL